MYLRLRVCWVCNPSESLGCDHKNANRKPSLRGTYKCRVRAYVQVLYIVIVNTIANSAINVTVSVTCPHKRVPVAVVRDGELN